MTLNVSKLALLRYFVERPDGTDEEVVTLGYQISDSPLRFVFGTDGIAEARNPELPSMEVNNGQMGMYRLDTPVAESILQNMGVRVSVNYAIKLGQEYVAAPSDGLLAEFAKAAADAQLAAFAIRGIEHGGKLAES